MTTATKATDPHQELVAALAAFQSSTFGASKDRTNTHLKSSYASLASVLEAIQPATAHGLSHTVTFEPMGEVTLVTTTLRHVGGAEVQSILPITLGGDWQRNGSAISYARRYSLMALYGIAGADDDDDGAATAGSPTPTRAVGVRESGPAASNGAGKISKAQDEALCSKAEAALTLTGIQAFTANTCSAFKVEHLGNLPATAFDRVMASLDDPKRVTAWNNGTDINGKVLVPAATAS